MARALVSAVLAVVLAAAGVTAPVPAAGSAAPVPDVNGVAAGNAAIGSVDLAGRWSFTPAGRPATTITVPGGGWYKQGFTDVSEATYSRTVTVPDSGQPQSAWIEFGAVNHQATLSVDGRVVATQTTSYTPSNFDITAFAAPGTTHTISVNVKGRNALKTAAGKYLVPDAANWSEAVPQGIFRSAFLRVYPAVYVSDAFVRTSVTDQSLTYDVSVTNTSASARTVTLDGTLASDNGQTFAYPALPSRTITVAARSTATVTVGPVAWTLGAASYWWPNAPYREGYRAQLHRLSVHATTDDGRTSDATYRFGFRESTQNGEYYRLNGVRLNVRGDNLQGADYDRIDNGGKGDAYDTLPGFLPAVDRQRRLAAGGRQLPAAQLQRRPHPPGAGQSVHARHGGRARPDDHRRDRHPRCRQRTGLQRGPRQHGGPRPCTDPARPQPSRDHPLEPDERAEPGRLRLRAVPEGPVRGRERRRRHQADHPRGGPRCVAHQVSHHDASQLQPHPALPRRHRPLRRADLVRGRQAGR
ncbi:hypothetical protein JOD27_002371 [Lentzea nigeriaca]|nr:hypothetical protein [Lentzea nigeriaca]